MNISATRGKLFSFLSAVTRGSDPPNPQLHGGNVSVSAFTQWRALPKPEFRNRFYRSCRMRVRLCVSRMMGAGPRLDGANGTGCLARMMASRLAPDFHHPGS